MAQPTPLVRIRPLFMRLFAAAGPSMDLRRCLCLISGHLTSLPNSGALAGSTVIVPNENISFGSARQQPMPMREHGDRQSREQAAAAPEKVSSSLSKICHVLVTLRETQVLY